MARLINYKVPESSFMTVEKDARLIVDKLLANKRLVRLLYNTTHRALYHEPGSDDITDEIKDKMITDGYIRIRPKITVDSDVLNYIIITFDNFLTNHTNPEFRDNVVSFDIVCHLDQWDLENMQSRPYRIAAEIDTMFNHQRLTGIGVVEFLGCHQIILNDEFAGLSLTYNVIHGGEDKNFNQDEQGHEYNDRHHLISQEDVDLYVNDFKEAQEEKNDGWTTE